ncbi:hypothetical protein G5B30_04645 [Sphingobacterium sp. SGG-5]|uniref:hypothetical protein n=1 Tax=Sphingobacterium sp. SGG-5 TaxID=2710881 RepID=UPI0013EA9B2E|nr:hypothetical protein [Sphingobacterium sp. SGG-5]NGM61205.1 hypothetical protein [Sphingobacterium sp. SGG-5]
MANLKTIVKEHPLKDIVLEFDQDITPPSYEQEALQHYYNAHDKTWAMKERAEAMMKRLEEAKNTVEDLNLRRLGMEQELEILEDWLGVAQMEDIPYFDESITIDINGFFEVSLKHNDELQALYEVVNDLTTAYNKDIDNLYEDDYLIDPMYFDVLDDVYKHYEEVSVHIVSLDDDHQAFLGEYGTVSKSFFQYLDLGEEVFERYRVLVEVTQRVYDRVGIVDQTFRNKLKGLE